MPTGLIDAGPLEDVSVVTTGVVPVPPDAEGPDVLGVIVRPDGGPVGIIIVPDSGPIGVVIHHDGGPIGVIIRPDGGPFGVIIAPPDGG